MKTLVLHSALLVALSTGLAKASLADESPPPQLLPCSRALAVPDQAWSSSPPAAKQLANLNVGPPRTVRLIYFLPNDRPYRAEVVTEMKAVIRQVQTFYAEQMQAHGYENRAFRFETDATGEPIVHRVNGRHSDSHYLDYTLSTVQEELLQTFDLSRNVYVVVIDNSIHGIGWGRLVGGVGIPNGKAGGLGLFHEGFGFGIMAHELGHTFGLEHDFQDDAYIMSYGGESDQLSACNAGILSVHPYFNHAVPTSEAQPPTIELISPHYPAGSNSASVQLRARDSEGLHQVTLFDYTREPHFAAGNQEIKACRGLGGEREAVVEFDYDGVIPSAPLKTSLATSITHSIQIKAVDKDGNVGHGEFVLAEISPHHIATFEHGGWGLEISLAFSPDGATLVTGLWIGAISLWDVATKKNATTLEAMGGVYSLAFSPDGAILATGSGDGAVKLWDVATKKNIATLKATGFIYSLTFSPDGATLASGSGDGAVKLWDVTKKAQIVTLEEPRLEGYVYPGPAALAFSPDGATLASGSGDGAVKLWDVATKKNITTLEATKFTYEYVYSLAFSPDGAILVTGSGDGAVKLWDVATKKNIATLKGHRKYRRVSLAFSPDGAILVTGSGDGAVKLWDVATKKNIATFGATGGISSVAFSSDGSILATGSTGDVVQLWDVSEWTGSPPHSLVKTSGEDQPEPEGQPTTAVELEGISTSHDSVRENDGQATVITLTVTLDKAATANETITLAIVSPTQGKTAKLDEDFDATLDSTLTIAKGQRTGTAQLTLTPKDNTMADGDRAFAVQATSSSGHAALINIKIIDNDAASEPQAWLMPDPSEVEFSADDPAWKTFTVHTSLDSVLVRANPSGSDPALEVAGGQQAPTSDYCPAEGNDRPTRGRRDGWSLHVKACQAGQTKILLIDYDTGEVVQQYEVNVEASTSASASTALNPSYPNPFNSETILSYTLPTASDIRLEVFTLNGQRVAVLHEGFQAAGYHTIAMDASDLASGVYLYRLTTPEGHFVQKFTLLR